MRIAIPDDQTVTLPLLILAVDRAEHRFGMQSSGSQPTGLGHVEFSACFGMELVADRIPLLLPATWYFIEGRKASHHERK